MIFLPIVGRELRVSARRKATYWSRGVVVLLATLVALYVLMTFGQQINPAQAGANLFSILSRAAFLCCLFSGVFLTADCLSGERREGTLGLLFLTDLRGYDVVLGKLMATSLTAFYGLLAISPVLAVSLFMGGVTLGEVCRMMLALGNTLIFSLAIGMFISSVSWKEQKAMVAVGGLLFLSGIIFPALGGPLEWASPRLAFRMAESASFAAQPQIYGWGLLAIQGASWLLLLQASRKARNSREEAKPAAAPQPAERGSVSRSKAELKGALPAGDAPTSSDALRLTEPRSAPEEWNAASNGRPLANNKELLDQNPIEWLASRDRSNVWVWSSLAVLGFGWFLVCLNEAIGPTLGSFVESFSIVVSLHAILKFWIALEAGRRFSEHRSDGTLELLLSTPLSLREMMRGQFNSLFKQFVRPIGFVLIFDLFLMSWLASSPFFAASSSQALWSFMVMAVMMGLLVVDAYALAWCGLWLGSRAKNSWTAAFTALGRIIVLPSFVFIMFALSVRGGSQTSGPITLILGWAFIGVMNAFLFGADAHRKLHTQFRETAARELPSGPQSLSVPPAESPELGEYFSLFKE